MPATLAEPHTCGTLLKLQNLFTHILLHFVAQGFFNDGHADGMDTDDPFAGWVIVLS